MLTEKCTICDKILSKKTGLRVLELCKVDKDDIEEYITERGGSVELDFAVFFCLDCPKKIIESFK